jgi:hypothetical protein
MTIYITKYERWYYNIIHNAKEQHRSKGAGVYYENHHIIPKSLGGLYEPENMVLLTGREHFICHWLLYKFSIGKNKHKMAAAWHAMCNLKNKNHERYKTTSKIYEACRKAHAEAMKELHTGRVCTAETRKLISEQKSGINHPMYGKKHPKETLAKMSEVKKGKVFTEDHKRNIGISSSKRSHTEETKKKISESTQGEKNHFYGKKHTEESKIKNRESQVGEKSSRWGKTVSEETRLKMSISAKNRKRKPKNS